MQIVFFNIYIYIYLFFLYMYTKNKSYSFLTHVFVVIIVFICFFYKLIKFISIVYFSWVLVSHRKKNYLLFLNITNSFFVVGRYIYIRVTLNKEKCNTKRLELYLFFNFNLIQFLDNKKEYIFFYFAFVYINPSKIHPFLFYFIFNIT